MQIKHSLEVYNPRSLFGGSVGFMGPITSQLTSTPVAGGMRHEVKLSDLRIRLKKEKNEIKLRVAAKYDPKKPLEGFATNDGYNSRGQHQFTI